MNTLTDLYLSIALDYAAGAGVGFGDVDEAKARTLHVLRNETTLPYEPVHALIVCSTHSFTDGSVLQWEIMGMHGGVLRFWMDVELHPETFAAASCSSATNKPAPAIWSAWIFMDLNIPISTTRASVLDLSPPLLSHDAADLSFFFFPVQLPVRAPIAGGG